MRRENLTELRATGTEPGPAPHVKVVRTGFEGLSKAVQRGVRSADRRERDLAVAKKALEFGGRLSFQGGMSIQRTLPFGKPEDVRREVKALAEAMAPGGGFIFCTAHNIQADTSIENFLELLRAYKDYGAYC